MLSDPFEFFAMAIGLRGPAAYDKVTNFSSSQDSTEEGLVFLYYLSGIMTFSTGIFLTIVRILEPLFRFIVLSMIYEFWGEIYKSKDGQTE